jgi:hypothetical protein
MCGHAFTDFMSWKDHDEWLTMLGKSLLSVDFLDGNGGEVEENRGKDADSSPSPQLLH